MDDTIHVEGHGAQHWAGDYFGPQGAIARSGSLVMQRMSTLYSAIGHCAAQVAARKWNNKIWYAFMASKLLFELEGLATDVTNDKGAKQSLGPGERDVLIATLLLTPYVSWIFLNFWHRKEAKELIKYQIASFSFDHVSVLFAKARASRLWFSFGEMQNSWLEDVHLAIKLYAPDGNSPKLAWTDVARLARLIGDKERQKYAAMQSGLADVKLKAGL